MLVTGKDPTPEEEPPEPEPFHPDHVTAVAKMMRRRPHEDELRLALAMRGGVSLAVWIGGAAAEIDLLCRSDPSGGGAGFWRDVRLASGYGSAVVDVMSGASAGGLNAVIGAAGMAYGFGLDALRDVWLDLAALDKLVRQPAQPGSGLSLLAGDSYFLANLRKQLIDLADPAKNVDRRTPQGRIDVTLAATLLEPVAAERILDKEDTAQLRFSSTFRFRKGSPVRTDFPMAEPARGAALARLALAGRATSSFPAAFEAAEITAPRPKSFTSAGSQPDVIDSEAEDDIVMTGVFAEASAQEATFCVMDGGVLDNIPIGLAIDAVVDAPADRPTRRVLVYVQPGTTGVRDPEVGRSDRSTAAVLTALVRSRVQAETIAGDLAQLDTHNARVRRSGLSAASSLETLLAATRSAHVPQRGAVGTPPARRRVALRSRFLAARVAGTTRRVSPSYVAQRASQEAADVLQLLGDPQSVLGGDPFPCISEKADSQEVDRLWRAPLAHTSEGPTMDTLPVVLMQNLQQRMRDAAARGGVGALTVGVGPIRRLAHLLIDASRTASHCASSNEAATTANAMKGAIYRVLIAHAELVERPRSWAWVVLAVRRFGRLSGEPSRSIHEWITAASDLVDSLTMQVPSAAIDEYLLGHSNSIDTNTPLSAADHHIRCRLDQMLEGSAVVNEGTSDVRELLIQNLINHARALAMVSVDAAQLARFAQTGDLGALVLMWLRAAPCGLDVGERLSALERATYDPNTHAELGSGTIDFVRLSSANPTPLAEAFPRLLGGLPSTDPMESIERRLRPEHQRPLTDLQKLAGNELMNFSAFLRRHWRANDWMWGRLDAVPSLVDMLVQPDRLKTLVASLGAGDDRQDEMMNYFHGVVCSSGNVTTSRDWRRFLHRTVWEPREEQIRAAVAKLVVGHEVTIDDLSSLRTALVAARQWDILADLLPRRAESSVSAVRLASAEPISPKRLVEQANLYYVGTEGLAESAGACDDDGKLVHKLVAATQTMLARTSSGNGAIIGRLLEPILDFLSRIWLRGKGPVWAAIALAVGGFAGLTAGAFITQGLLWEKLVAAAAGPAALMFLVGLLVYRVFSRSSGFLICLVAAFCGFWAAWVGGFPMMAVSLGIVGFGMLLAGTVIAALIRLRPPIPHISRMQSRRASDRSAGNEPASWPPY